MSIEKTREQQELAPLLPKEMRLILPPSWLTRRFFVFLLISMFTIGPLPIFLMATAGDQFIRNWIDTVTSDPEMYKHIALQKEEYEGLPLHWRQAFAELAVRTGPDAISVLDLIKTFDLNDIALVDRLAPYLVDDFIVRDTSHPSSHPIPELLLVDFSKLEDLGILQSVQRGNTFTVNLSQTPKRAFIGKSIALTMDRNKSSSVLKLPITRFTEPGLRLMYLLRVPSDLLYFEWLAKQVERSNIKSELWMIRRGRNAGRGVVERAGRIQRDSITRWSN